MIEDVLQTIEDVVNAIAPPGFYPFIPSAGATGIVAWDASAIAFGSFKLVFTVTTSGPLGTAMATLSLDGGLTTSPPFLIPALDPNSPAVPVVLPFPLEPYSQFQVYLLDPINPGGDPSPVLSGLVLAFYGTFTEGDSYTSQAIGQTNFLIGEENLPSVDQILPRVIWVLQGDEYSGSEDYALGTTQRNAPRSLMTSFSRVDAHIWGLDRRRTDILRQQVINGIHFAAQNVYTIESGQWQLNKDQVSKLGRLYVLHFGIKIPVQVFPPEFVLAPPPFQANITPVFDD